VAITSGRVQKKSLADASTCATPGGSRVPEPVRQNRASRGGSVQARAQPSLGRSDKPTTAKTLEDYLKPALDAFLDYDSYVAKRRA